MNRFLQQPIATLCMVIAAIVLLLSSGCATFSGKTPDPRIVGVAVNQEAVNFGDLLDQCEAFIKITEIDNSSEVAFRSWYFRNLERASACSVKHEKIVELLRKHDLAK